MPLLRCNLVLSSNLRLVLNIDIAKAMRKCVVIKTGSIFQQLFGQRTDILGKQTVAFCGWNLVAALNRCQGKRWRVAIISRQGLIIFETLLTNHVTTFPDHTRQNSSQSGWVEEEKPNEQASGTPIIERQPLKIEAEPPVTDPYSFDPALATPNDKLWAWFCSGLWFYIGLTWQEKQSKKLRIEQLRFFGDKKVLTHG